MVGRRMRLVIARRSILLFSRSIVAVRVAAVAMVVMVAVGMNLRCGNGDGNEVLVRKKVNGGVNLVCGKQKHQEDHKRHGKPHYNATAAAMVGREEKLPQVAIPRG